VWLAFYGEKMRPEKIIVCVSGASAGIGLAVARALAGQGCDLMLGARRVERLADVAAELSAGFGVSVFTGYLDVTDGGSVKSFVEQGVNKLGGLNVLVNNAGLGRGVDRLDAVAESDWQQMFSTNVEGVLRMTQAALPHIRKSGWGHIINLGSIAGHGVYAGGGVYCATKHALDAVTSTLRLELNGEPIRVTTVDPGMVETEFSIVRLGDAEKASNVYRGMTPLVAEDIAECVRWVVSLPDHVNIDQIVIKPRDQADLRTVSRK
jgi:NADP-dependent 3-hydroxy acid dehydrogenase YdfG